MLIGLGGLGAEVAKNLTLAGIKSLTVVDHRLAQANSANFLLAPDLVGQNVNFIKNILTHKKLDAYHFYR